MAPRYFGTDGMRGVFGQPPLDRDTVAALGLALARELVDSGLDAPEVVLGGDTRDSTPTLCQWLASGLVAGGARVRFVGVLPTPGIARVVLQLGAGAGVAVSASHNPYPDNGIKLVDGGGFKWSPEREMRLEDRLTSTVPPADEVALGPPETDLVERYLATLVAALPPGRPLAGRSIALDTAFGAASPFAARLFRDAGAEVTVLHDQPDGTNINRDSGSTHPERLQQLTRTGFDLGIAFDGDADRALLVDEQGRLRDGDEILFLWARALREAGALEPARIVATSMSNLGLERALARHGIAVERCGVGDREVVARLLSSGLVLGGEQSGHVVNLNLATTGDGFQTALAMAHLLALSDEPLSALLAPFERFPQVLLNVRVTRKERFDRLPGVAAAARAAERALGTEGRLVLRYSGTEPLARIMIEGPEQATIEALARNIATEIERVLA